MCYEIPFLVADLCQAAVIRIGDGILYFCSFYVASYKIPFLIAMLHVVESAQAMYVGGSFLLVETAWKYHDIRNCSDWLKLEFDAHF